MIFFFKEFYDEGKFEKCLNGMFLVLISKKEGVEDLKEFRPRSLVKWYVHDSSLYPSIKVEEDGRKSSHQVPKHFHKGKTNSRCSPYS